MTYEHCTECDAETGRAGKHDDSLYHASEGPYCVECYECWAENMICERDQLRADNQRLREAIDVALTSGRGTSGRIILDLRDEAELRAALKTAKWGHIDTEKYKLLAHVSALLSTEEVI
jgi:hypothetical protein